MKRFFAPLFFVLLITSALTQHAFAKEPVTLKVSDPTAKKQLDRLMHEYYEANAQYDPVAATFNGDNRFDDQLGMSISPKTRANHFAQYRKFSQQLHKINQAQLDRFDLTNYECLDHEIRSALSFEPFPDHMLPINQMESLPVVVANFAEGKSSQPITTPAEYRAYLSRITQLSAWIDQAITNMRAGIKKGIVQPKALIVSALPQFKKMVSATPEESIFYAPIKNLPATFSDAEKKTLTTAYQAVIDKKLNPALSKLAAFLENDYLPATRNSTGWGALPNGKEWYKTYVANTTTTSLSPKEIHAIGLKEVKRIQAQFALLGPKLGYSGTAENLPKWVAAQNKFFIYKNDSELLAAFNKLNAQLDNKLPTLFSLIPKSKLEVRLEPELTRATASMHYTSPKPDGSRPGIFWVVAEDPKQFNNTELTSLFLHEGRPGHHFQIALQQEVPLPNFRKFGYNTAYTEGWALYAESLGHELGLYDDPEQYFGNLNMELLRAVRLVVDAGMHAQGWTREQTIQYIRDTLGYSEAEAKNATERYMALPGQALGYKIGAMKIAQLRQKAATMLGSKFSLPAFHAIIIDGGNLPMTMLENKVDRWISELTSSKTE